VLPSATPPDLNSYRLYSVVRRRPALTATALDAAAARVLAAGNRISERSLPQSLPDTIRRGIKRAAARRSR
jgi:hypothetical protein